MTQPQQLIWEASSVHRLRTDGRVLGNLVGTLPRCSQQNVLLGLPLQLSAGEAEVARASMRHTASPPPLTTRPDKISAYYSTVFHSMHARICDALDLHARKRRALAEARANGDVSAAVKDRRAEKRGRATTTTIIEAVCTSSTSAVIEVDVPSAAMDVAVLFTDFFARYTSTGADMDDAVALADSDTAVTSTRAAVALAPVIPTSIFREMRDYLVEALGAKAICATSTFDLAMPAWEACDDDEIEDEDDAMITAATTDIGTSDDDKANSAAIDSSTADLPVRIYRDLHARTHVEIDVTNYNASTTPSPSMQEFQANASGHAVVASLTTPLSRPVAPVIGCGQKFGGEFCVYGGDPYRFHSLGIVHCVAFNPPAPSRSLLPPPPSTEDSAVYRYTRKRHTMLDLISWGRVANVTKKVAVVASEDTRGQAVYFSVEWFEPMRRKAKLVEEQEEGGNEGTQHLTSLAVQ